VVARKIADVSHTRPVPACIAALQGKLSGFWVG